MRIPRMLLRTWRWLALGAGLLALALVAARWVPHASLADAVGSSRAVYARDGTLMRLTLASSFFLS